MSENQELSVFITVYKTYYTPESIDAGESDRAEEVYLDEAFELDELVHYLKREGFSHASDSHGVPRWVETHPEITDYAKGESAILSIHPAQDALSQTLWEQALIEADFPFNPNPPSVGMRP